MDYLGYTFSAVIGLIIGSFLNAVIYRLPRKIPFGFSRSICPNCQEQIKAYDNIPLLSYLILGGKCRNCKASISIRYPAVEALNGLAYAFVYHLYGLSAEAGMIAALLSALIAIIFIDSEHQIIPDVITLPGIAIGLLWSLAPEGIGIINALIGAAVGYGALFAVALLGDFLFKKESMGGGDLKMTAMLGAFIGWQRVLLTFMLSAVVGLVVSLIFMALSSAFREERKLPFGPYLAIAGFIALFWGDQLIDWYISSFLR
jgi:leader peptidase (prepilin peptidase)/N-methyltransferase